MSTGYLRWGGWAAVSTSSTPTVLPSPVVVEPPPATAAEDLVEARQMQCGEGVVATEPGGRPQHGMPARVRSEQPT
jgi:hypothetical protein